ncbi:MAG: outer membrane protein transport protein [Halioglobus sp.]
MKCAIHISLALGASFFAATYSHATGPAFTGLFAKADSASTVFANPAGMSRLPGTQMSANGILVVDFSEFEVDENKTTVDGGNPREPDPTLIPSFFYSRQFHDDWHFGASLNVPTGFGASNGPNWAGRYYNDRSSLVYIALSPAVSYRINDDFSVGAATRIMYSESDIRTRVNNNLIGERYADGKLEAQADGLGAGFSISGLYTISPDTRVGLVYNSQVNIDMDSEVDLANVRRPPEVIARIQSQTVQVADNVPMNVGAGVYHRLQNDWDFTLDVMWMDFSKFGVTEVYLEETDVNLPQGEYNDFFMVTAGTSWPINSRMRGAVGVMWMEQPMDEASRTFGMALDEMYGVGGGITYKLAGGNDIELSIDLLDTGSARIDTGDSLLKGRVAGESKDPYSLLFDFTYNWR